MRISITTPFSGKTFCFYEYAKTVEIIVKSNPDIEFVLSALDNSHRDSFKSRLEDLCRRLDIKLFYAKEDGEIVYEVGNPRMAWVNKLYNRLVFDVMPQDVDYCLVIEDDIAFDDPEAIRKCLEIMESDLDCATVTANTLARWHRARMGRQQSSIYKGGTLEAVPTTLSGAVKIDTSAMGFWFTRMAFLEILGLPLECNGRKCTDGSWSEHVRNHCLTMYAEMSIHCRHYYLREDDMMKYVSCTHNSDSDLSEAERKRIAKLKAATVAVRVPRDSSSLFAHVPRGHENDIEAINANLKERGLEKWRLTKM